MVNLLKETMDILNEHNKRWNDVIWVGCKDFKFSSQVFRKIADVEYDGGFGWQEVADDLLIVGSHWWLERHQYDGSEWWDYKEIPLQPGKEIKVKSVSVGQSERLGYDVSCGRESLANLNNIKK